MPAVPASPEIPAMPAVPPILDAQGMPIPGTARPALPGRPARAGRPAMAAIPAGTCDFDSNGPWTLPPKVTEELEMNMEDLDLELEELEEFLM